MKGTFRAIVFSVAVLYAMTGPVMAQSESAHNNPLVKECQQSVSTLASLRQSKRMPPGERARVDALIVAMELQCVSARFDKAKATATTIRETLTEN